MLKSFKRSAGGKTHDAGRAARARVKLNWRDPGVIMRAILGVLTVANLVAAVFAFHPFGGSAEDLEQRLAQLKSQIAQRRVTTERLSRLAANAEKASSGSEKFLGEYFLGRRTAYSNLISALSQNARTAGIKAKEHAVSDELVEGSDTLSMLTITAGCEATYADLIEFVNLLDRSRQLVIIESLQAAPQAGGAGMLNVTLRFNAFVRDDGGALPPPVTEETSAAAEPAEPAPTPPVSISKPPAPVAAPTSSEPAVPAGIAVPGGARQRPWLPPVNPDASAPPPPPPPPSSPTSRERQPRENR
jgi:hypothetical protein